MKSKMKSACCLVPLCVFTMLNLRFLKLNHIARVPESESLYNRNVQLGLPSITQHPGIGLCDCECNTTNCEQVAKAVCDNSKWTTECNPVGTDQDSVYKEQCRRIIFNKRKKRSVGDLQDDYSSNERKPFSMEEPDDNDLEPVSYQTVVIWI